MSDLPSLFLTAAFTAGIIEGASVLRYHRNALESNENSPATLKIAAYSTLYGAVSLPLGVIGASPGTAFYPKALELSIGSHHNVDKMNRDKHAVFTASSENATLENGLPREMQIRSSSSTPVTGSGRGIGRRLREENLKKMHSSYWL